MSIHLASTTDSEEVVKAALEATGQYVESSETLSTEPEPEPKPETPAPAEPLGTAEPAEPAGDIPTDEIEDESDTSEQELDESGRPKPKGKPGQGFQKRIKKLETHISERDRKIAELEGRLAEVRQAQQKPEEKPAPAAAAEPPKPEAAAPKPKPELKDFEDYEQFTDALTDWKLEAKELKLQAELDKLRAELAAKDEARDAATVQSEADAAWAEKVAVVKADLPDWDEVAKITDPDKMAPVSPAMANAIYEADENGVRVLHYLATHLDEAKRIFELTNHKPDAPPPEVIRANRAVGREYARIEALVKKPAEPAAAAPAAPAATPPPAKPKSQAATAAPPPIRPGRTATAQATEYDPRETPPKTHKEYMEWWNAKHPNGR
jgi:hypothetical protein